MHFFLDRFQLCRELGVIYEGGCSVASNTGCSQIKYNSSKAKAGNPLDFS